MAEADAVTSLRVKIGETIPEGGSDADTLFTDAQVGQWVDESKNLNYAAVLGWEAKMAHWAGLVSVTDGASSREMSDLMDHAVIMANRYGKLAEGARAGRTRVGKIVRS